MTRKSTLSALRATPLLILLCLLLVGCACKHQWQEATCSTPKTCSKCQVTEGEALTHTWVDVTCAAPKHCSLCNKTEGEALPHTWEKATCTTAKTCTVCQATEGEALGHTWEEATCTTAKTCTVCQATEGEALGHKWRDANCTYPKYCPVCYAEEGSPLGHQWKEATTEAPQTCTKCGNTQGSKINAHPYFTTSACKPLFGTWVGVIKLPGSDLLGEGCTATLELDYTLTFGNSGNYTETCKVKNKEQFIKSAEAYYIDALYKQFAAQGYNQTQADEAMKAQYGMDVKTYANKAATSLNLDAFNTKTSGNYYVGNNKLYTGRSWSSFQSDGFKISGNTLTIDSLSEAYPGLVFTKS